MDLGAPERFQTGDTRQFTFTTSIAPNSAPIFSVTEPFSETVIASFESVQSDSLHYAALYTMPQSEGHYIGRWYAEKTVSSSVRQFSRRFIFEVRAVDLDEYT